MKKKIAREILYVVCFAIIVGLFSICIVSYNKLDISKLNKAQTEIQTNYSFLLEKNIQSVCFTNGKLDYTIPLEMVDDFTVDRNDLKLVGKISMANLGSDENPIVETKWTPPKDELENIVQRMIDAGEPEENIATVIREYDKWEKYSVKNKAIEKLSPEESKRVNAYIANTKQSKILSNRILTEKDIYYNIKIVALILLIALFIIRYLFYTVSWSIKTLKE